MSIDDFSKLTAEGVSKISPSLHLSDNYAKLESSGGGWSQAAAYQTAAVASNYNVAAVAHHAAHSAHSAHSVHSTHATASSSHQALNEYAAATVAHNNQISSAAVTAAAYQHPHLPAQSDTKYWS